MTGIRIDAGLLRAAAVTLAAAGFYRLLQQLVTVPGLDLSVLAEWFPGSGGPPGLPEGGHLRFVSPWMPHAVSGTAAIGTYVSASVLVLLASGLLPFLRRLREAGPARQAGLQWVIAGSSPRLRPSWPRATDSRRPSTSRGSTARCPGCRRSRLRGGPSARERS